MGGRKWLAFFACVLSVPLGAKMLDGITAEPTTALAAGVVLGIFYMLLRPVLRILTIPIGCITLGLSGFVIDCLLIMALGTVIPGFRVDGFVWAALLAAIVDALCVVTGGAR